ncbi:hypothetical protein [Bradyrhizobium lablabi]|uniref:hypothetical protein n=1 Tax=Bradyrhizobium lablabi TaxID=722472 RepID=UPI001BAAF01B|nr:hypothetical protein [Bradyrhizobium lablabi]MBR0694306.1 hypothetical protein [Bradyrhizobium lablabi]
MAIITRTLAPLSCHRKQNPDPNDKTPRALVALQFTAIDLDTLLPSPEAQLVQIGSELDCDLVSFGARASKIIIQLLTSCGSWPRSGIVQASYQDSYVSSPLVARLLIDTMSQPP